MSIGNGRGRGLMRASGGFVAALTITTLAGCSGGGGGGGGGVAPPANPPTAGTPIITPISTTGHDRLFGVTFDAAGNIFGVGVISDSLQDTDFETLVVKFRPDGTLDTTFGNGGSARVNFTTGTSNNAEVARGIAIQSTGKIVVSATIEPGNGGATPTERNIALARFTAAGVLDPTFGTMAGIATIDLSANDQNWTIHLFANDDVLVTGSRIAAGRSDSDFLLGRLNPDGIPVTTYATGGFFSLDIANASVSPRTATILGDGSVVGSGYSAVSGGVVSPVLFKLTPAGTPDPTFGNLQSIPGVFNQEILDEVAEAYGAAVQGGSFVTVGYGHDVGLQNDFLSIRVTGNGQLDTTYGNGGAAQVDVAGFSDQARAIAVLPEDRVVLVGGGRTASTESDGMIAVFTPNGQPETAFGLDGFQLFDLGGPVDFFWGIVLSPDQTRLAVVGIKTTANEDDDTVLLFLTR